MFNALLVGKEKTKILPLKEEKRGNDILLSLKAQEVPEGYSSMLIFYEEFTATDKDSGFYVYPECAWTRKIKIGKNIPEGCFCGKKLGLHTLCGNINGKAFSVAPMGLRDCYSLVAEHKNGTFKYYIKIDLYGKKPYQDFTALLHYYNKNADYIEMAKWYREFLLNNGYCQTLAEKVKTRPHLKNAVNTINLRIRMAWKQAPSPVLEQTAENEPLLTVACTFKMVEDLIKELKNAGVENIDICLVGWNVSGHDGRWPQMFPIEPELGGEAGLKSLIKTAKEAGYSLNLHTNCIDAYSIADNFSESYIAKNTDGSLQKGGVWSAGQAYLIALKYFKEEYCKNLKALANMGITGTHYTDVLSLKEPLVSFLNTPMTEKEYVESVREVFGFMQQNFGASSCEGGSDLYADSLDYALYSQFDPRKFYDGEEFLGENIPFWYIVMHGIMLYNSTTYSINYMLKDGFSKATALLYGARPACYAFVDFHSDNIWGREDLRWQKGEKPIAVAQKIATVAKEYKENCFLQYSQITDFKKIDEATEEITYSCGTKVLADFKTGQVVYKK